MNVEIGSHDILFGKGKGVASHSGNVIYREIIDRYYVEYYRTESYHSKKVVADKVRAEIANLHPAGRFLSKKRDQYFVFSGEKVDKKIKQALRDRLKKDFKGNKLMKVQETAEGPKSNELKVSENKNGHSPSSLFLRPIAPPHLKEPQLDFPWNESEIKSSPLVFDLDTIKKDPSSLFHGAKMDKSDMSFDSFISQALSSLSLKTCSVENLNASSVLLNIGNFPPTSDDSMMDGGLMFDDILRNDKKMLPRQREMLLKKIREEPPNRPMNYWPSSIPIESDSPIMMPNDLDLSTDTYDGGGTSMSSFNTMSVTSV